MLRELTLLLLCSSLTALGACSSSKKDSSSPSTPAVQVSEQKLVTKWCTTSWEKMDSILGGSTNYQFYHRVTISGDGLLTWQAFTRDHGTEMKSNKKTTCRQASAGLLHCDAKGVENVYYELVDDGRRLDLSVDGDGGQKRPLIENGGALALCDAYDNQRFDQMTW